MLGYSLTDRECRRFQIAQGLIPNKMFKKKITFINGRNSYQVPRLCCWIGFCGFFSSKLYFIYVEVPVKSC